jgi:hypothetical protein
MIIPKHAVLALGLLAGMSQGATSMDLCNPGALLMKISEYGQIRNAVRDLSTLSEVRKVMLVDVFKDMLGDDSNLRLDGYVFQTGEPDLRVVAGRAEWFIDQIVLLPREAENSRRKISERIEMWKASTALQRTLTPQQVETLRTKYSGKVRNGIFPGAFESIKNFQNFLDEWFPYGKSLQEMEGILDVKLPVEGGEAVLRMDSGLAGMDYRFLHNEGKIRAVKAICLN